MLIRLECEVFLGTLLAGMEIRSFPFSCYLLERVMHLRLSFFPAGLDVHAK